MIVSGHARERPGMLPALVLALLLPAALSLLSYLAPDAAAQRGRKSKAQ